MKILLVDNFDSFTYNLSHYLTGLGAEVEVIRQDMFISSNIVNVDKIVLSPGPGLPNQSEGMIACLHEAVGKVPILGVCLGMQAISQHFGGTLYNQEKVKHGIQEYIQRSGESILLRNIPTNFAVGLYHSWAVELAPTSELSITSFSTTKIAMSFESERNKIFGVQFHPESIMTPFGKEILNNFLQF